ncbi:hypothetical protein ACN47E_000136 [Coniothyrium glycines]
MLYHILPAIVTSRVPALPSLRRSVTSYRTRSLHSKSSSLTEITPLGSPPPCYSSRPVSGSATPDHRFRDSSLEFSDDAAERPRSSGNAFPTVSATYETETGVNWRYASQGVSLMSQAYREASNPVHDDDETSTALTRQLYMHGITYLLRGLPADLAPDEKSSLYAAMPQDLTYPPMASHSQALMPLSQRISAAQETPAPEPTMLHRITATCVFQIFILAQFLLPYIKILLAQAYQLERKHQITRRVVDTGVATMDELGRRSMHLSQMVCRMHGGKVGQAIEEMTILCVKSVTGGVQQGIKDGLSTMRAKPEGSRAMVTAGKNA